MVEILAPLEAWESVRLWRQDEMLPVYLKRLEGQVRILADWPRSGCGHYGLRLELPDQTEEYALTIQPEKISPDAYARMLEHLETRLPVAVALGLQRAGALTGIALLPPGESTLAQEMLQLRRAVLGTAGRPGLAEILVELARDPHQILDATDLWVRRERARRPHPAQLAQALSQRHNLEAGGRPTRVLDTRVVHTVDVFENQLVNLYSHQAHLRLRRLLRVLEAQRSTELLEQARALRDQLQTARRQAAFLDNVGLPTHLPTHLSMVLLKRPPYRAALEGYLEFHKSVGVRLEEPALDAPLENLPDLYQLWGTLEVTLVLLQAASELGYRVKEQRLVRRDARGLYIRVFPEGKAVLELSHPIGGTVVTLTPEPNYGKFGRLRSISYRQVPDVAVGIWPREGPVQVYLFDPKYKLEGEFMESEGSDARPKKVDIDKMHAYRDAIRNEADKRVVRYAAILYPGPEVSYSRDIEALSAYPGSEMSLERRLRELFRRALAESSQSIKIKDTIGPSHP